jgi:hypothetical protein
VGRVIEIAELEVFTAMKIQVAVFWVVTQCDDDLDREIVVTHNIAVNYIASQKPASCMRC